MPLIKAKHEVYGEVEVPDSYLRLWPDDYTPIDTPKTPRSTGANRASQRTTTTKEGLEDA